MNHDDYNALRQGKLSILHGLKSMIGSVGAGVYTYMVMLNTLGREKEASFFSDIRDRVFQIRDRIANDTTQEGLDKLSNEMTIVYHGLNTAYIYLQAHKPEESAVLQSVTNTACGLIYNIKHFNDEVKNF